MSQTVVSVQVGGTGANNASDALSNLGAVNRTGDVITGTLNVAATLITQNVLPDANVTYDLGSNTARFKDLWLSNSTIFLGEASISANGNTLVVPSIETVSGVNVEAELSVVYAQANAAYDAANNAQVTVYANNTSNVTTQNVNFVNTETVTVTVTADGSNANIAFSAASQTLVDDTYTASGNTTAAATANIANGLYEISTNAYAEANLKLNLSGGTIDGSLNVNGIFAVTNTSGSVIAAQYGNIFTTSAVTSYTVDTFAAATYRSAKYFAQQTSGSTYGIIELNLVHDGSTVYLVQYGENKTNASANLGVFDAEISGGDLNLTYTPGSEYTTQTLKISRVAIPV